MTSTVMMAILGCFAMGMLVACDDHHPFYAMLWLGMMLAFWISAGVRLIAAIGDDS